MKLTKRQAVSVYKLICKRLGETAHPVVQQDGTGWPSGPVLCQDYGSWSTTTKWAIVWEEGPYEWAIDMSLEQNDLIEELRSTRQVYTEAIESFSLALCSTIWE